MSEQTEKATEKKTVITTVIGWTDAGQLRVPRGYKEVREALREGKTPEQAAKLYGKDAEIAKEIAGFLAKPPAHSVDVKAKEAEAKAAEKEKAAKAKAEKVAAKDKATA